MATTTYEMTGNWDATNRITAVAEMDILLANPSAGVLHWAITADDVAPPNPRTLYVPMMPSGSRAMILQAGERLWFAGTVGAPAVVVE